VIPIQQVVPEALAAVLRRAPLTPEKIEFAWRSAVGAALAHGTTVSLRDGVLTVVARDGHWEREVNRARPMILARLKDLLGDDVSSLTVSSAAAPDSGPGGSGSARRRR